MKAYEKKVIAIEIDEKDAYKLFRLTEKIGASDIENILGCEEVEETNEMIDNLCIALSEIL